MRVYTKGGDKGTTSLVGGERVSKNDCRVEAYGTVDELSAFVALLSDKLRPNALFAEHVANLDRINSTLMTVEAHLACDSSAVGSMPPIGDDAVAFLEFEMDTMESGLEPITKFTIPGGDVRISLSHVCRTICRRAERRAIAVADEHPLEPNVVIYLNRLSDYFYLLGRTITAQLGVEEILWIP
ncbi:MAG: cob(I)yrinic acid a,c-diamide adenosyltransferase [Rikenellaceae bacterium]